MADLSQLNVNNNDYNLKDASARTALLAKADKSDIASTQTVSGNPITLNDAAPINAESLVVELEPKQDLHGYDFPWVGGAGLNKVDINPVTMSSDGYYLVDYVIPNTLPAGTYTLSIKSSSNAAWSFWVHDANGNEVGVANSASSSAGVQSVTFTTSGIGVVAGGYVNAATTLSDFMLESGSVAHDYQPYSNICPITGYTECEVDDVGKNLLNPITVTLQRYLQSDGSVGIDGGSDWSYTDYIKIEAGEIYTLSGVSNMGTVAKHCFYDENKNFISSINTTEYIFTAPANAKFVRLSNRTLNYSSVMLEKGNQATTYEPYHSSNATIQFGQTVYGGRSNFTDGGTKDKLACIDLGGLDWTYDTNDTRFYSELITNKREGWLDDDEIMCSCFKPDRAPVTGADVDATIAVWDRVYVKYAETTDAAAFTTLVTGQTLTYPLATATTLSTPVTPLKLLKGTNHLTTNGTTITLWYQPDNVIGEVKGEIEKIKEMPYLRILDNDVDTEVKNYRLYYRLISSSYTLVNLVEMLQHRFLFVEIIQNPSGTANHTLLHSALIDPRTIDGFEYQMKAGTGDTVIIESNIAENKFDLSVRYTGTHTSGDPTDYYVTIRMVD